MGARRGRPGRAGRRAGRPARTARPVGTGGVGQPRCSPRRRRRRGDRRVAAAARPDGRGRHGAGDARAGRRRLRRRWRARVGPGDGQGDGQAGARRQRHRPGPLPGAAARTELDPSTAATLAAELGLPCFVKPSNMGSSVGVTKAHDLEELRGRSSTPCRYDEWVVVEEAVVGREIEVAVLGGTDPIASARRRDRAGRGVLQLRGQVRHRRRHSC